VRVLRSALALVLGFAAVACAADDGVFVRFKLDAPTNVTWLVRSRLVIHVPPWQYLLPPLPEGADTTMAKRHSGGEFTAWLDVKTLAGAYLHDRKHLAGGLAEFPCLFAAFEAGTNAAARRWVGELATAPDEKRIVRHYEQAPGETLFGFLVSPQLTRDKAELKTVAEMAARHLRWARAATGGRRVSPGQLILQTQFWGISALDDVEAVWLLGFNQVDVPPAVRAMYPFHQPAGHHWIEFGPEQTAEQLDRQIGPFASNAVVQPYPAIFGFSDEIASPPIGTNAVGLTHFRAWLAEQAIAPADLGVSRLADVIPIEVPKVLRERQEQDARAANRVFYHTSRFRQASATERIRRLTGSFHRQTAATNALTSTLVADHPYFSGTGLGMGMDVPDMAWGNWSLALDWFELARLRAVDVIGIEDWMGLQYMYGPTYTWEGPQLMGFQTSIMRSGGGAQQPVIAWITPSNDTNFILKATSALAQGAKHLFFWTYGPTCSSTENYWSDLRGAYDGMARYARQLAAAEHIIAPGTTRPTRVALLYSISSDLWQPFGYIHMLERRGTYLSLVHDQYLVDLLTEQDIEAGRLASYDVLYAVDACLTEKAAAAIVAWVRGGGHLYGACGAGSRNEFNEPAAGLAEAFGIAPQIETIVQPGEYRVRGNLNDMAYTDQVALDGDGGALGALGVKALVKPVAAGVAGRFRDGSPAVLTNVLGHGQAVYFATCPALAYIKEAKFVRAELKEEWPAPQRRWINDAAARAGAPRLVEMDHAVVEAGVYDAPGGSALVLANFTYEPIRRLTVRIPMAKPPHRVRSLDRGRLRFTVKEGVLPGFPYMVEFRTRLNQNDIVTLE
jgi:hypothetical protein